MFRRYWIVFAVSVGLAFSALGQAQEGEQQAERPANEQEAATDDFPVPLPVVIIESDETTSARQSTKDEASNNQKADLIAQQGMDAATQRMANYAKWQTLLILIGTIALLWTLYLTRSATKAAQDAVGVTRKMGEAQTRAYLSVSPVSVSSFKAGEKMRIIYNIKNLGNSPAFGIYFHHAVRVVPVHEVSSFKFREPYKMDFEDFNISPKQKLMTDAEFNILKANFDQIKSETSVLLVCGHVRYKDVFRRTRRLTFCYKLAPQEIDVDGRGFLQAHSKHNRAN